MFKKFKDKLAEEMKQSPARLQASMQQLAQAVVSPALSNSSIQELSASHDNFSLTEEGDETPKNSPAKHGFQNVDLTSPTSNLVGLSRRSSVSSVTSVDATSLFPIYESPGNMYHLQSDVEQSASEADENLSPQLDRISKDQLYAAYRKVQTKYHKYRGRYTDLANHYREMERVKGKLESLLVETQDKALRRIADLKEQCQLEQQAKAHLEDALRNDIEEKDHVIGTLNTKIMFLQTSGSPDVSPSPNSSLDSHQNPTIDQLIDVSPESTASLPQPSDLQITSLVDENSQLKLKLEKLESLITKYKESSKRNKEKLSEITQEKNLIERDFEKSQNSNSDNISSLEKNLAQAREEITNLNDRIESMKKREEESAISLAENKLSIHRELEVKETQIKELRRELKMADNKLTFQRELEVKDEHIKELQRQLKTVREARESLETTVERSKNEMEIMRTSMDLTTDAEKADLVRDLSKGKTEALKLMQKEMQKRVNEIEETMGTRFNDEEMKNRELSEKLSRRDDDMRNFEREIIELRRETENYREKCEDLRNELSIVKDKEYRNEIGNRNVDSKRREIPIEQMQNTMSHENILQNEPRQSQSKIKDSEMEISNVKNVNNGEDVAGEEPKLDNNFQEKGAEDSEQAEYEKKSDDRWAIEREKLTRELSELKINCEMLKKDCESLRSDGKKWEEKIVDLENVGILKDETIRELNSKIESYAMEIAKSRDHIEEQQRSIEDSHETNDELKKLKEDLKKKSIEIVELSDELNSCKSTIDDMREKSRLNEEKLYRLNEEKIRAIGNILNYKKIIVELRRICEDVGKKIDDNVKSTNDDFANIRRVVSVDLEKYFIAQTTKNEKLLKLSNDTIIKLENELKNSNEEISLMRQKVERWDEINRRNEKLIAEIDNLNFKIVDFKKLQRDTMDNNSKLENCELENLKLRKNVDELSGSNEELKIRCNELVDTNEKLNSKNVEIMKNRECELAKLTLELNQLKLQHEEERKNLEKRNTIEDMEISKMKSEHENYEKLVADYAEKIKYFEIECANRDKGLEELRFTMEKREKILEETVEKLKNCEFEISKLNDDKIELQTEIDKRGTIVDDLNELTKNLKNELSIITEQTNELNLEIVNREKMLEDGKIILKNFETNLAKLTEEKSMLQTHLENREKLLATTENNLQSCEIQCAKISAEKSEIALKLEISEKSMDETTEKLKNLENELSKLSREKLENSVELENREKTLREEFETKLNEKSKKMEIELMEISEEKKKLKNELENYEKTLLERDETLKDWENRFSRMNEEKSEIMNELKSLEIASEDFDKSNEALKETVNSKNVLLKKLKVLKERQSQTIRENETKILELEKKISHLETEKLENTNLRSEIKNFEIVEKSLKKDISDFEDKCQRIIEKNVKLEKDNEDLKREISENSSITKELEKLKISYDETKIICDELKKINEISKKMENDTRMELEESQKNCADLSREIVDLKNVIAKRNDEFTRLSENSGQRLEDFEELRKKLEEDFRNRGDNLEDDYMEKYREREAEMKRTEEELKLKLSMKEAELEAKNLSNIQDDDLRRLVEQLQKQLQEKDSKFVDCQTKSSQIQFLNDELKSQADKLKRDIETGEAEQSMRLKQLVKEFQAQLHDKDEELQAALDKRFESQQNHESDLVKQYREQLKDFQIELTTKSEQIENLLVENRKEVTTKNREMEKLIETIGDIKQEHANEIREIEGKWRATLKQKNDQLEAKHEEEVRELTREWQHERRTDEKTDKSPEELESTSRVAMAAVQSNTGSLHSLQQTLVSQRRELAELRKLVKLRHDNLEDSTEIEYLRNILYEYMMGRETVVLARVIAAVVKFDQEQTTKILKKEEDKLTLLGSLGLS